MNKKRKRNYHLPNRITLNYLILSVIFVITSYLSIKFVQYTFGGQTVTGDFLKVSIKVLFELVLLALLLFLFDTLRFFYIFKTLNIKINFWYLFKLILINFFISNITPYAIGGSVIQIYYLNKDGISLGRSTAATTIKNMLPLFFYFFTTPIILLTDTTIKNIFPNSKSFLYIFFIVFVYVLVSYLFLKLIFNSKSIKRLVYRNLYVLYKINLIFYGLFKKIGKSFFKEIDSFTISLKEFVKGSFSNIVLSAMFTILYLLAMFYFSVILVKGFGYNVSTLKIMKLQDIIVFLTYFAPTPGSTGIAEGLNGYLFSDFVKEENLASLTFMWRFFSMYLGMIIGFILFYSDLLKNRFRTKKN